jgi:hypothetical protein
VYYHVLWTCIVNTEPERNYHTDIITNPNYSLYYMYLTSICFLLINPCLNAVVVFCTSSPFRQHLKRYLTCFCKTNSPPSVLELTLSPSVEAGVGAVSWGTVLHIGRFQVRFTMLSIECFNDIILSAALWHWIWHSLFQW